MQEKLYRDFAFISKAGTFAKFAFCSGLFFARITNQIFTEGSLKQTTNSDSGCSKDSYPTLHSHSQVSHLRQSHQTKASLFRKFMKPDGLQVRINKAAWHLVSEGV
jgi:hypothetical protein